MNDLGHPRITQEAAEYHATNKDRFGLDLPFGGPGPKFDPDLSRRTAVAFEKARHLPMHPKVKAAYDALKNETKAQYDFLVSKGVKFEPWHHEGQPYANSAEMAADARDNKHLHYFPTVSGFGQEDQSDHPLYADVPGMPGTKYNDLFRAVHDYFGHARMGNQFGPKGELAAWGEHARMYSPLARAALTAETHGQNSWVNFGPHSHLPVTQRPYAEQKATVLPKNVVPKLPRPAQLNRFFAPLTRTVPPESGVRGKPTASIMPEDDSHPAHEVIRRVFPNATFHGPGVGYNADVAGRWVSMVPSVKHNAVHIEFGHYGDKPMFGGHEGGIKPGTPELLRSLDALTRGLAEKGVGIKYTAGPKRAKIYERSMQRAGMVEGPKNPNQPADYIWHPAKPEQPVKMSRINPDLDAAMGMTPAKKTIGLGRVAKASWKYIRDKHGDTPEVRKNFLGAYRQAEKAGHTVPAWAEAIKGTFGPKPVGTYNLVPDPAAKFHSYQMKPPVANPVRPVPGIPVAKPIMTAKALPVPPAASYAKGTPQNPIEVTTRAKPVAKATQQFPPLKSLVNPMRQFNGKTKLSRKVESSGSVATALRDLLSKRQAARRQLAVKLAGEAGLKIAGLTDVASLDPHPRASVVQTVAHGGDHDVVDLAASWYGLLAQEPRLTVFHEEPQGPDRLHVAKSPMGVSQILATAAASGINTASVGKDGTVHTLDHGGNDTARINAFHAAIGAAQPQAVKGFARQLGSGLGDQSKARRAYREAIKNFQGA